MFSSHATQRASTRQKIRKTKKSCHSAGPETSCTKKHPDHSALLPRLRRVRGQIDGLERMILDRRYCVDILIQFRAAASALKTIEGQVFGTHLRNCVQEVMTSNDPAKAEAKIEELVELVLR